MGWRTAAHVKVGDPVLLSGKQARVIAKEPWPEGSGAALDGYTLTVRFGDTGQQHWVLWSREKIWVDAARGKK